MTFLHKRLWQVNIPRPISSQQPGIMAGKVFAQMLRFVHTIEPTPPSSQPRLWYRKLPHFKLLSSSQWQFQRFAFASFRKCKADIVLDSQKFGNQSGQAHKVSKVCRLDLTLILLSDSICPQLSWSWLNKRLNVTKWIPAVIEYWLRSCRCGDSIWLYGGCRGPRYCWQQLTAHCLCQSPDIPA